MKKLFLLFVVTLSTALFAQSTPINTLSTTAIAIKQDSTTKTITVLQLSNNPAFVPIITQPSDVVGIDIGNQLNIGDTGHGVVNALSKEVNFSTSDDKPYPTGYVIIVWQVKNQSGCGCSFNYAYAFPDDGTFNGQFLAYTNSLTTVRDVIINKLYSGL